MFWEVFCQGIGQTLGKDDRCASLWSSTINYVSTVCDEPPWGRGADIFVHAKVTDVIF